MDERKYSFSELMDWVGFSTQSIVSFEDRYGLCVEVPYLKLSTKQHYHHGSFCEFAKIHGNQPLCAKNKQDDDPRNARAGALGRAAVVPAAHGRHAFTMSAYSVPSTTRTSPDLRIALPVPSS